jgi:tricorn protease
VDLDGIADRVLAFPVPEGRYQQVGPSKDKVLLLVRDAVARTSWDASEESGGRLQEFDFETRKVEHLATGVESFRLSRDGGTIAYRSGSSLRVFAAGTKPEEGGAATRATGWLDLSRIRVSIAPPLEWRQMLLEAWRLQRDHFWVADMSGVAWEHVRDRYLPLVDRIGSRAEFSDLVWELQGELGTSHAYEYGGEQRGSWEYAIGRLGIDLERAPRSNRWRIARILRGDSWEPRVGSPLAAPGLDVKEGSTLLAIAGHAVTVDRSPHELLVGQAGTEVELLIGDAKGAKPRRIAVRTLWSEDDLRYREWVDRNRAIVHERTKGRVGYVHIPDMGPGGYGEFHRSWPAESERRGGLVVDVRCNGGGHVSQLLLEKLARRALGFGFSRWGAPETYPRHAVLGPMVAITNEVAGSDGDIFSHAWKMLGLGPLIGMRTWGGVIGISPSHPLADGSLTTQPEYAFWFNDTGYAVENYGTDPDVEVDIAPHDWLAGRDTQLDHALELMATLRKQQPGDLPDFGPRPQLAVGFPQSRP